jgi:hypothetical protein
VLQAVLEVSERKAFAAEMSCEIADADEGNGFQDSLGLGCHTRFLGIAKCLAERAVALNFGECPIYNPILREDSTQENPMSAT